VRDLKRAVVIIVGLAFAIAAAGAIARGGISVSGSSSTATLPNDNAPHATTASCPHGKALVGGGLRFTDPVNDYAEGTYPKGKRSLTAVAFGGLSAPDATLTGYARCLKGANVTVRSFSEFVPTDSSMTAVAKCPAGSAIGGGGIKLSDPQDDYVAASYPAGDKWKGTSYNGSSQDVHKVTAYAFCVKGAESVIADKKKDLVGERVPVKATAKCPKHTALSSGGIKVADAYSDYAGSTYPNGSRAWTSIGAAGSLGDSKLTAFAVCLKT
jgi:hypothetical protein